MYDYLNMINTSYKAIKELHGDDKISDFDSTCNLIRNMRRLGHNIVLAQGVFDIVHAGHVGYLRAASNVCRKSGILVVGLENNASVAQNKGLSRPINDAGERAQVLAEFESVDIVFIYPDVPRYYDAESF